MSVIQTIRNVIQTGETGPNEYVCTECDREFEADAPPERTICSACGNKDVEKRDE